MFAYELGYRTEPLKRLTLDATVFIGDYHRLQTLEPQTPYFTPDPPPHLVLPNVFGNLGKARNYGIEASAHWNAAKWWRISPGFSFVQMDVSQNPRSQDRTFATTPGESPKRQAQLRSSIKLPHNLEWDTSAYYVGPLVSFSAPSYTRLDTRLGCHVGEFVEISLAGQNLLRPRHLELFDGLTVVPTLVGRDMVAKITWHF